jgi:uroporphyrinogen-III decarboxylase
MQFLFGTEKLFIELAYASKDLHLLRDIVHDFFMEELRRWVETDVDGISFMDDWGTQRNLLISPQMWRELFKPLYKDYCDLIHSKNKYAFFHSDGCIEQIYPELIEVGVDAILYEYRRARQEIQGQDYVLGRDRQAAYTAVRYEGQGGRSCKKSQECAMDAGRWNNRSV